MESFSARLNRCFTTMFPGAAVDPVAMSPDIIAQWDSTNHLLLIQVVEDEFGISIPEAAAGELLSYADFEAYLHSRVQPG